MCRYITPILYFNILFADLRILFTTSTNQIDNLWNLVRDMHQDIHTVSLTTTVNHVEALAPTLNRIQQST